MIDADFTMEKGTLKLRVRGHAGAAPMGQDLVCAGVSSLALTAAEVAARLEKQGWLARSPLIRLQSGTALILLTPHKEVCREAALCFWTVQAGLERLEQMYPGCIRINRMLPMQHNCRNKKTSSREGTERISYETF